MDLNELSVFATVVRLGSFTAAARELEMQKSGVSRKVSDLEERLRTRLLQRTTRKLALTDAGRIYYEHCARMLAEVEEAEAALSGLRASPSGVLRVTAPLSFGFIGPYVGEFLARHPQVQVELVCTDRVVDLVEERFDLAIRAGTLPDSALVARRLGSLVSFPVASPLYLKRRGRPRTPQALAEHECLSFGSQLNAKWRLVSDEQAAEVRLGSRLVVNDLEMLREAALTGLGIAMLPDRACGPLLAEGRLERVLPGWTSAEIPIHALYASTRHLASKTRAFIELLQARMGAQAPTQPAQKAKSKPARRDVLT
ncbi:LysR family transcriptional regulator [Aggregicoccus sp. 17bor-14]|uniref:LysR family transcriptional regulator n=1 Tax=Myxococcaceae TaxID=31 RepID=UPI00129CB38C|nr:MULTISPECIES: LysR family transcriptional regulator [Myxococcaceae]MBF5045330.1 LysR family transcriptional regulator [Simulacricoccus sp. 17bor-14]MRI91072.1 LysR family transcriptional regulator [Aggregicoccus sp. 17bor-14]